MNKHTLLVFILLLAFMIWACNTGNKDKTTKETALSLDTTLPWSQRMAHTMMTDYPDIWLMEGRDEPSWRYTYGLIGIAFQKLWQVTPEDKYYDYVKDYADDLIDSTGNIRGYKMSDYNIDKINSGNILFLLYKKSGDEKYKIAMDTLRKQLKYHPRTSGGGFWHKKRYPHQMWLDGLYMGGPFYAHYGVEFNQPENFDDVANWLLLMYEKARDEETGLLYHAWDESLEQAWADDESGLSSHFWGRGMGWYTMALVDILDYLPLDHPRRPEIVNAIQQVADAILKVQDETGVWFQVLNYPYREGNYLEGSVSSMFTYFLLKAVKKEYLDESYFESGIKAYEGIITELIKVEDNGRVVITPVCAVAGLGGDPYRDGSYEYYINEERRDNDPKAVGPFIMASLLYEEQFGS